MFEGFKPTAEEKRQIETAWRLIRENLHDGYRIELFTNEERRGYGNPNDRVPLLAAKGMMVSWFLQGWNEPDAKLRDLYWIRPAALYAQGAGAAVRIETKLTGSVRWNNGLLAFELGKAAYDATFKRMHQADVKALGEAFKQHFVAASVRQGGGDSAAIYGEKPVKNLEPNGRLYEPLPHAMDGEG